MLADNEIKAIFENISIFLLESLCKKTTNSKKSLI
jgi:hypothetical protein